MVKINLLPDIVLERRRQAKIRRIANLSLTVWAGLVLAAFVLSFAYNQFQTYQLEQAREERDEVASEANSPKNVAFREKALTVQSSLESLNKLYNTRRSVDAFLEVLSSNMPDNVRLSGLNYGSDGTIRLSGRAPSYQVVGVFEKALKNSRPDESSNQSNQRQPSGYFTGTTLGGVNIAGEGEVRFELTTKYVATGTASGAAAATPSRSQPVNRQGDDNAR